MLFRSTVFGAVAVVVFVIPATVRANGAADAEVATIDAVAKTAAARIDSFLFILSFSLLVYFPRFLPNNLGKSKRPFL